MSNPPSNQPTAGSAPKADAGDQQPVTPPFDEQLRAFWGKNRNTIYVGVIIVMLAVVARYGYEAIAVRHEAQLESEYAAISTPARFEAFARSHDKHPLAGAAWLKLADDAYSAGSYAEAIARYDRAAAILSGTPFGARALLGKAMAQIQSGKTEEGTAALRKIADDANQFKGVRCEAATHLAALALDAGTFDEVTKRTDQVMQLDPTGAWAQRAMMLRARVPVAAAPSLTAPKPAAP